jgi:hypothetical protein
MLLNLSLKNAIKIDFKVRLSNRGFKRLSKNILCTLISIIYS